jgi:hypothetical protein
MERPPQDRRKSLASHPFVAHEGGHVRLAIVVGFSSAIALILSIASVGVTLAGTTIGVHTRSAPAIGHDYGRAGEDAYWAAHADPAAAPTTRPASASSVAVGAEPPVQQDTLGWHGRAGGFAGSVRVERLGEPGHSADGGSAALTAEPENWYGRAGRPLLPATAD